MNLTFDDAEKVLCKESGLKALSGGFNDIRDIEIEAARGNSKAQLALDVLAHQARHWIGAFFLQMNGADALVFTAGAGENRASIRNAICANLDQLGIVLDPDKNNGVKAQEAVISANNSRVKVLVIPTNEELVVAREVKRLLEKSKSARLSPESTSPNNKTAEPGNVIPTHA
jgi:acetate kinase